MSTRLIIQKAQFQLNQCILGKPKIIELALSCLLANGHLLIEDQPGVGKTLLASALGHCLGLETNRIQFASDVMPSDITGSLIYRKDSEQFEFRPGPVFTQLLLADEINRAPSKTQSALLQAMEEQHISVDGQNHALPSPFFVIGTQNPLSQIGTFALPESQLDRFLVCLSMGLADPINERALLAGHNPRAILKHVQAQVSADDVVRAQHEVNGVHISEAILDYVQALIAATRQHPQIKQGLSTRGALALIAVSKAFAWLNGRDYVTPEDLQSIWLAVTVHRLVFKLTERADATLTGANVCLQILQTTPITG